MRILWHSAHPDMPTGYANQTAIWVPRLAAAGHDVAISVFAGLISRHSQWRGFPVFGCNPGPVEAAEDVAGMHYQDWKADLVITLVCPWKLHAPVWRDMTAIHLMPVDCSPLGWRDRMLLENSASPGAVTRFGEAQIRDAGYSPLYLPHAVDTSVFTPPQDRAKLRKAQGMDHMFVAGICASNTDSTDRKNFSEMLAGFAAFHGKHPKSMLLVHALYDARDGGLNLAAMAERYGIADVTAFSDVKNIMFGVDQPSLAAWYGTLDVLLSCGNEGYGIPVAEAQACGTPVITSSWGGVSELCGAGWRVDGQPKWQDVHYADWHTPFIASVAAQLSQAYQQARSRRAAAREFAAGHLDADKLFAEHWKPALDDIG